MLILNLISPKCISAAVVMLIVAIMTGTLTTRLKQQEKLQVNMANIRKKLGCCPGENRYVVNELGVGYRMLDRQE